MLFSLWIGCVVPETCENGSKSAWETVGLKQLDGALLEFQIGIVLCWTKVDDVDWPGGGYSCSRKLDKWYVSEKACSN